MMPVSPAAVGPFCGAGSGAIAAIGSASCRFAESRADEGSNIIGPHLAGLFLRDRFDLGSLGGGPYHLHGCWRFLNIGVLGYEIQKQLDSGQDHPGYIHADVLQFDIIAQILLRRVDGVQHAVPDVLAHLGSELLS